MIANSIHLTDHNLVVFRDGGIAYCSGGKLIQATSCGLVEFQFVAYLRGKEFKILKPNFTLPTVAINRMIKETPICTRYTPGESAGFFEDLYKCLIGANPEAIEERISVEYINKLLQLTGYSKHDFLLSPFFTEVFSNY